MTKTYAVIGDPIDHSLSPNIHNAAFKGLGMDCTYIAYRIPDGELEEGVESLKKIGVSGFNVTLPHKVQMMKYLDAVDADCEMIGATNTVTFSDGRLKGHNTDMKGFLDPIKKRNLQIRGSRVLLLGAGGAARAVVSALYGEGVRAITIANRTIERADELARFAKNIGAGATAVRLDGAEDLVPGHRFVINCTSVGLGGEPSPIPTGSIGEDSVVYDIVYMPVNTDLIKKSKEGGATIIYGYEMLLGQACRAFEIWHKRKAPYDAMKRALLGGF